MTKDKALKPELEAALRRISDLPTLPAVLTAINKLMQDPRTSAEELGRTLATDPALTAKVLKLVNSAFYGFPGRIGTITQAVVVLGFSTVRNVVLTTSVLQALEQKGSGPGFDVHAFWLHSFCTGATAKVLARELRLRYVEEAFIAGLIHDMGKLILRQYLREEFDKVLAYRNQHDTLFREAEGRVLGFDHQDLGAYLAERWNLPKDLIHAIANHHQPLTPRTGPSTLSGPKEPDAGEMLARMVHAADIICRALEVGDGGDSRIPQVVEEVWSGLGLTSLGETAGGLDGFLLKVKEETEKAKVLLNLM